MNIRLRRLVLVALFIAVASLGLAISPAEAAPPNPVYGVATVDGNSGEWNLTTDYFADMYEAARPDRPVEARLYLRYRCQTNTLYALVLPAAGFTVEQSAADAFIKIGQSDTLVNGSSGNNGSAPDFSWIAPNGTTAAGWEASAILMPGTYNNLNVHTHAISAGGQVSTAAVANRSINITINCSLAAELDYLRAVAQRGSVRVEWATASEINSLGFNIYRSQVSGSLATTPTRVNPALIPSQAQGSTEGAAYVYTDNGVVAGRSYQYWLETVATDGTTHRYGPVTIRY